MRGGGVIFTKSLRGGALPYSVAILSFVRFPLGVVACVFSSLRGGAWPMEWFVVPAPSHWYPNFATGSPLFSRACSGVDLSGGLSGGSRRNLAKRLSPLSQSLRGRRSDFRQGYPPLVIGVGLFFDGSESCWSLSAEFQGTVFSLHPCAQPGE